MFPRRPSYFQRPCQAVLLILMGMVGGVCAEESHPAAAPADYLLTKWDQDDGMPGNTVSAIVQTSDGFLWIGTYDGLARFDGSQFVIYPSGRGNLPPGRIRALAENRDGSLWIGMEGAAVVREKAGDFQLLQKPSHDPNDWLTGLAVDARGRIWLGLSQVRAWRWQNEQRSVLGKSDGLSGEGSVSFSADRSGKLWFSTDNSYGRVDGDHLLTLSADVPFPQIHPRAAGGFWLMRGNVLLIRNERDQLLYGAEVPWRGGATEVQVLYEDRAGALWIGTKGQGLFRFDGEFTRVPASHGYILALTEDTEGDLWVGTLGGGVVRLHPRNVRLHDEKNGLPADVIDAVCEDSEGGLWFAARNAGPIRFIGGRYTMFSADDGWPGGFVTTLCPDGAGGVWFGTLADGLIHWSNGAFSQAGLKGERIQTLLATDAATLWIATDKRLLQWRDGKELPVPTGAPGGPVTALAPGAKGQIWLGTQSGNVASFDGSAWHSFDLHPDTANSAIRSIVPTENGAVWIASGSGLFRLKDGKSKRLTEAQGLPSDDLRQLVQSGDAFWIGSVKGLFRASIPDLDDVCDGRKSRIAATRYGRDAGLGSIEFAEGNGHGACHSQDGRLWFATRRGVAEVNPAESQQETMPPPVHIEQVVIGDQIQAGSGAGALRIPPGAGKLEIHYIGIALSAPEKVRYRYRLTPGDHKWTEAGGDRAAIFHGLAPGSYQFEVQASTHDFNADEAWSARTGTAVLHFQVQPSLSQRRWFQILCAVSALAAAGVCVRLWTLRRIRRRLHLLEREQALETERARIARDMHDELGASLTSISLLSQQVSAQATGLPTETASRIEKISQAANAVSRTLDEIVWTVNPRNDTLEGLVGYIGEYAAEFLAPSGILLTLDLPVEVPSLPLSSEIRHQLLLVVKEALNNAVKSSGASEITIGVAIDCDALRVQIADNGKGFNMGANGRFANGHVNMQDRLTAVGGSCTILSAPGEGTRIQAILPLPQLAKL